jgi:uncharacterized protein YjbI with pentapeptide repeats
LSGATIADSFIEWATFQNAQLSKMTIRSCMFGKCDFSKTVAPGLKIAESMGVGVKFCGADLSGASIEDIDLGLSDFRTANLSRAVLRKSRFHEAIFSSCDLSRADLTKTELYGANLSSAVIEGANFKGAKYDRKTKWGKAGPPAGAVLVSEKDK